MVGIMNPPGLDSRNIDLDLKRQAEEAIARRYANSPKMSQYTPKKGEMDKLKQKDLQRIKDEEKLLNKFANSRAAGNLEDAMFFATDVLSAGELGGLAKNLFQKLPKFNLSKAALATPESNLLKEMAVSSIVNKQTGKTQFFDKQGLEIGSISIRSPKAVKEYNQSLKNQLNTGATPPPPEWLRPY